MSEINGNQFSVNIEGIGSIECRELNGIDFSIGVILNSNSHSESSVRSSRGTVVPGRFRMGISDPRSIVKVYKWFKDVMNSAKDLQKRKVVIKLKSRSDQVVGSFLLSQCWPCQIYGPNLNTEVSIPIMQYYEFVYESFAIEGLDNEYIS